jgi:nuclear transport factor 2 (NTF2) superfamily protein
MAEDAWNSHDPAKVALAYTVDSRWRNRAEFLQGRNAIVAFLTRKWNRELDYRLIKELWAFRRNASAHRQHQRSADRGGDRRFLWPLGRRPDGHRSLSELGS